jgi:hypothetical protein
MRPLSEALTVLIATAEDIMRRPSHQLPTDLPPSFADLAREIRHADALPAENIRTTRAGIIMCTAIEAFFAEPKTDHHWQMVVGTVLPLLKLEAWQARANERQSVNPDGYTR